jgi:threonine/homoserine/homoserine lactone efflux protein
MVLGAFGYALLPHVNLFSQVPSETGSIFLQGVLLTAANPLTILFWGGVFSAKAAEKSMGRAQLLPFGLGCVLSTLLFLSAVALAGSLINSFLPPLVMMILNAAVGCALIFFGVRLLVKKDKLST